MFNYILELVEGKSYFIIINSKDQSCLKLKKNIMFNYIIEFKRICFYTFLDFNEKRWKTLILKENSKFKQCY